MGRTLEVWGLIPFDLVLALATLLALPQLWRARTRWLRAPAGAMVAALAGTGAVSELLRAQPDLARRLAEQLAPVAVAAVVALHAARGVQSVAYRAAIWGGGVAIAVGLVGWALDRSLQTTWFSLPAPHPVFDEMPRLFGTFAGSPQRCGSFAVFWLVAVLAGARELRGRWPRLYHSGLGLGASALLLSMSYAWVGGFLLVASRVSGRFRRVWWAAALLAALVASIPILRGPRSASLPGPCRLLDVSHLLALPVAPGTCSRVLQSGRAVTLYHEAKRVSWSAFLAEPWTGVGYLGFADFSERAFEEEYGMRGTHYTQPHGVFHGLPAKHGLLGLLAMATWAYLLPSGWRGSTWDFGVVAFLLIGLHIDVDRLRELWVLLGFLLAEQCVGDDARETRA